MFSKLAVPYIPFRAEMLVHLGENSWGVGGHDKALCPPYDI